MTRLVLIPGVLCDRRLWAHQIDALQRDAEISVADITRQTSLAAMAADVLDDAPARFCLAGFSLGSQVAMQIMQTAPERVERLALLSATPGGVLPATAVTLGHALTSIEQGGFEEYLKAAFLAYFSPQDALDPALKRTFLEMAHSVGQEAGLRQIRVLLTIHAFTKLDHIRCPTVLIGGKEDHRTTPEAHGALAQQIAGSRLVLIENSGHFTTLEQPQAVTAALQSWLMG